MLKKQLVDNKLCIKDKLSQSGVHQVNYDNCDYCYYVQTGRNIKLRFNELIRCLKLNRGDSNVADNFIRNNNILKILIFCIFVIKDLKSSGFKRSKSALQFLRIYIYNEPTTRFV